MRNIFFALLFCCPIISFAFSNGTYIGQNSKRINISSYQDSGTYQYEMIFTDSYGGDIEGFQNSSIKRFEEGRVYFFKQNGSPYNDTKPSECTIKAVFLNGVASIDVENGCEGYIGQYAFSEKASFVPEKYIGKWDKSAKCNINAAIEKEWFTTDIDWGGAVVVNVEENQDGSHTLVGIERYEDGFSDSKITLKLIGDRLSIKGEHHAEKVNKTLIKCK